jgi:ABC-type tungstate transport system substrate-binding protein
VHCAVPVTIGNYRWGTALPGIILGIIPFALALILQNGWLLGFGLLFTLAAGGDFLILWLLRNVESEALVQDHPELIGCRVINCNKKGQQLR